MPFFQFYKETLQNTENLQIFQIIAACGWGTKDGTKFAHWKCWQGNKLLACVRESEKWRLRVKVAEYSFSSSLYQKYKKTRTASLLKSLKFKTPTDTGHFHSCNHQKWLPLGGNTVKNVIIDPQQRRYGQKCQTWRNWIKASLYKYL